MKRSGETGQKSGKRDHPSRPLPSTNKGAPLELALAPLKKEMELIAQGFQQQGLSLKKDQHQGRWFYFVDELNLILSTAGHGKAQYALVAQNWLHHFKDVHSLICVGAAGALTGDLSIGDLLIASPTREYDYKEGFNPSAEIPSYDLTHEKIQKNDLTSSLPFNVLLAPLASGDEDITSRERALELHQQTKALAVAWEGAGAARVARWNKLPFAEIRSITDKACDDVAGDFYKNLPQAMTNLSVFLTKILSPLR